MQAEKIARALEKMQEVQQEGIVRSGALSRSHQELLVEAGFLQEILRGWYYVTNPTLSIGATAWYGHYWHFLGQYLTHRFGTDYCLLAEASLEQLTGSTVVPRQLALMRRTPGQQIVTLCSDTSLLIYQEQNSFPEEIQVHQGIQIMSLAESLTRVSEPFFHSKPQEATIALQLVQDPTPLLHLLLERGKTVVAGRLLGAFRHVGRTEIAERIFTTMKRAGHDVRETNPFLTNAPMPSSLPSSLSPASLRIQTLWQQMRSEIIPLFSTPSLTKHSVEEHLSAIEEQYVEDAYHSLSIEGYKVTAELIQKIRLGEWNPTQIQTDQQAIAAMAARGYFEAFQEVKNSLARVLGGESGASVLKSAHHDWHQSLFAPAVRAGLLSPVSLAGYRRDQVYIQGSRHIPLPAHAVLDAMETYFDLLASEENPAVRAVLGHFFFVYIHPYSDGNGRMARFIMNLFFLEGGFPWTIVPIERRSEYMTALEEASVQQNIRPFVAYIQSLHH
jgi:fido (protein-threonine AMPylation protein)